MKQLQISEIGSEKIKNEMQENNVIGGTAVTEDEKEDQKIDTEQALSAGIAWTVRDKIKNGVQDSAQ